MDDLVSCYQENNSKQQDLVFNDTNDEITVIELTRGVAGGPVEWKVLRIQAAEKDAWISADTTHCNPIVLLQLLQVRLDNEIKFERGQLDISRDNFHAIVSKFHLNDIIAYGKSSVQSFGQISNVDGEDISSFTAFHIADYFAQFHKFHGGSGVTQGIYWAGQRVLPFLHNTIIQQRALARHPFFLNLCTAIAFEIAISRTISSMSELIAGIEHRTGFKIWDLRRFQPVEGSYSAISATTSGYATSLAANKRLNRLTRCILTSFDKYSNAQIVAVGRLEQHQIGLVVSQVDLLLQQNETQLILIDFMTTRVQNQLTALFNLITQRDTQITISLAKDSRTIATASKYDSTSMKTLAAVTVVFLPGTFVASLFSMTLFDWDATTKTSVLNKRFWVYWAVTIPLTAATVAAWLLWTRREALLQHHQEVKAQEERKEHMGETA